MYLSGKGDFMATIIDGIEYVLISKNNGDCIAAVQDIVVSQRSRTKEVTIPASVEGFPVTSILQDAFQDASWIEKINLPHTICSIGPGAFDNCKKLKQVHIACHSMQVQIHRNAFSRCWNLEEITVEYDSVLSLNGPGIFKECANLKHLPMLIGDIPDYTFLRCGIQSVAILGEVNLNVLGFYDSNVKDICCERLETIQGEENRIANICIKAEESSPMLEYLAYNGYPVAVNSQLY